MVDEVGVILTSVAAIRPTALVASRIILDATTAVIVRISTSHLCCRLFVEFDFVASVNGT